jgi:transposase
MYAMEATGVYYEELAWFLHCEGQKVSVVFPNRARQFARSLEARSKTDKIDARVLAQMALERELPLWNAPSMFLWMIKMLNRERASLNKDIVRNGNRRHALDHGHVYHQQTYLDLVRRSDQRINLCKSQVGEIDQQMKQLASEDASLHEAIQRITEIPGIGFQTALTILAETDAFANIANIRQLVCYSGLDVKLNESGRFKGRSTISKQGNSFIRSALYMPALAAIRHNIVLRSYYEQLYARKKNKKMAIVAVMRKLLVLIYTLYRSGKPYDPCYKASASIEEKDRENAMPEEEPQRSDSSKTNVQGAQIGNTVDLELVRKKGASKAIAVEKGKREQLTHPSSVDEPQPDKLVKILCFEAQR